MNFLRILSECGLANTAATNSNVVAVWQQVAQGRPMDTIFSSSTQEEDDSKRIFNSIHAANAAGTKLKIYSSDSDISIFALSNCSMLNN